MRPSSLASGQLSVLPSFLSAPRISAKLWVAAAVGIGCMVSAYAGLYPRFDAGEFRILIALTSGPFGAAVAAYALGAKTWGGAFWRALLVSAVLGVASTVLPGMYMVRHDTNMLGVAALFGTMFGAPTGATYGLPIAVLVAMTHRRVVDGSQESNDRASRLAGVWLSLGAAFAAFVTWELDVKHFYSMLERDSLAAYVPAMVAGFTFVVGLVIVARASLRLQRRATWIDRVSEGGERWFRIRPIATCDEVEVLPRLGPDAKLVVEWNGAGEGTTAYRMPATGTAVALVSAPDRRRVSGRSEERRSFATS